MNTYKNILVYAMVNLGDVILVTSAISLLKKTYPDAKVTMMAKPAVRQAIENNPVIDEVIIFDYESQKKSLKQMWNMVGVIKRKNFDLAISFDRKLRPALLCWLAGIPKRVGPSKVFDDKSCRVTWLYTDVIHIEHDLQNTLQAETYQTIVRKFTGAIDHATPVFAKIDDNSVQKADELLAKLPVGKKRIALCVKGTFPLKTWPKEYFAQVVEALYERYSTSFFIVGAPNDRDYADEVIRNIKYPVENFCGDTTLVELAALISKADLMVTVDTGGAHIAATTGIPMITIYGCTHPNRWKPINKRVTVMTSDEKCCPCSCKADECPYAPRPKCLEGITPNMVIKACCDILE